MIRAAMRHICQCCYAKTEVKKLVTAEILCQVIFLHSPVCMIIGIVVDVSVQMCKSQTTLTTCAAASCTIIKVSRAALFRD